MALAAILRTILKWPRPGYTPPVIVAATPAYTYYALRHHETFYALHHHTTFYVNKKGSTTLF